MARNKAKSGRRGQMKKQTSSGKVRRIKKAPHATIHMTEEIQKTLESDPGYTFFNKDYWRIVSEPTFASGLPDIPLGSFSLISIPWLNPNAAIPAPVYRQSQFLPFKRLPTELQLAIWALALPDSRVVQPNVVHRRAGTFKYGLNTSQHVDWKEYSSCKDQLNVFNDNYKPLELRSVNPSKPVLCCGLVNYRRDTIVQSVWSIICLKRRGYRMNLSSVEKLALVGARNMTAQVADLFAQSLCPHLRLFTLIMGDVEVSSVDQTTSLSRLQNQTHDLRLIHPQSLRLDSDWDLDARRWRQVNPTASDPSWDSIAMKFRSEMTERNVLQSVQFKHAMLARVVSRPSEALTYIIPIVPQPYKVIYTTQRPTIWKTCLEFDRDVGSAWCWEDGTLFGGLEGIRELFVHDGEY